VAKDYKIKTRLGFKDDMSKRLNRTVRKVKVATAKLSRAFRGAAKSVAKFGVVAATAAAVGLAKIVQSYGKSADEIAKFSRQIGIGVETLQEYRFAAERAGIGTETMDKALEKVGKNLGEAKVGTGTLVTFLNKYNPAMLDAIKNTDTLEGGLALVIDEMAGMEDETQRAAFANAAFGRSGLKMARLTELGKNGIKELRREARRYGLVSEEQARAAEKWMDAQADLQAALKGVQIAIGSELLPTLRPYIEKLTEWVVVNKKVIATKIEKTIMAIVEWLKKARQWWIDNEITIRKTGEAVIEIGAAMGKIAAGAVRAGSAIARFDGSVKAIDIERLMLAAAGASAMAGMFKLAAGFMGAAGVAAVYRGGKEAVSFAGAQQTQGQRRGQQVEQDLATWMQLTGGTREQALTQLRGVGRERFGETMTQRRVEMAASAQNIANLIRGNRGQGGQVSVDVNFRNAPPGTVTETRISGEGVSADVGRRMEAL